MRLREPWRCDAGAPSWGPLVPALVLSMQQPRNRRILLKAGWGRQLFILVCTYSSYTKGTLILLWILEVPFWDSAKDMWGLQIGHNRVLLPLVSHQAHLGFQHRQQMWSHCSPEIQPLAQAMFQGLLEVWSYCKLAQSFGSARCGVGTHMDRHPLHQYPKEERCPWPICWFWGIAWQQPEQ